MNIFVLLLATISTLSLASTETSSPVEINALAGYSQDFLLPVDVTKSTKYNLSVSIPKGFKSLQPIDSFGKPANFMLEFIPEADDENNWNEIITLNKFIGKQISAIPFTDTLKMEMIATTRNSKILVNTSSRDDDMQKSNFIMRYTLEGKQEVIGAQYFSGPLDAAGVQYTIRLNENLNEEEAVKKIHDFFTNNLNLIGS